jgi:hypothetical protein
MDATARFLAIVAVAAFVTERILATIRYFINALRLSHVRSKAASRFRARELRNMLLFLIAAVVAYVVVVVAKLRLLTVLQVTVSPGVDFWLTWLVVVAGADRVHAMLKGEGADKGSEAPVVRIEVDGDVRGLRRQN